MANKMQMTEAKMNSLVKATGRTSTELAGMPIVDNQVLTFKASANLLKTRSREINGTPATWLVFIATDGTEISAKQFARRNNGLKLPDNYVKALTLVYNTICDAGSLELKVKSVKYSNGNRVIIWDATGTKLAA